MRELQLPASVQEVADVIGRDAALRLVQALPVGEWKDPRSNGHMCRRIELYVPQASRLKPDHALIKAIGVDDAVKLCLVFGGTTMRLATCKRVIPRGEIQSPANDNRPAV